MLEIPSERIASHFEVGTAALITGMRNIVSLHLENLAVVYKELGIEKVRSRPWTRRSGAIRERLGRRALSDESREVAFQAYCQDGKGIPEGNGNMLDNTLIVYLSCSGDAHHDGLKDWPFVLVGGMSKQLNA